jgi:hypothetical protein
MFRRYYVAIFKELTPKFPWIWRDNNSETCRSYVKDNRNKIQNSAFLVITDVSYFVTMHRISKVKSPHFFNKMMHLFSFLSLPSLLLIIHYKVYSLSWLLQAFSWDTQQAYFYNFYTNQPVVETALARNAMFLGSTLTHFALVPIIDHMSTPPSLHRGGGRDRELLSALFI